jgi:hypothetical protein
LTRVASTARHSTVGFLVAQSSTTFVFNGSQLVPTQFPQPPSSVPATISSHPWGSWWKS